MPTIKSITKTAPRKLRAAQYVRMSTDAQKYSIENQMAAIAAHAARRHIAIVRTYADAGRSGLRIKGRAGLQDLIRDVQLGQADFDCILVYDITRWGRFQDVDESAYYEFICKRAGVRVHYCADEFENDGSLASIVLKNIKRVAAADYSKQLSKKVFLGQCRVVTLGYWRGGPAGYGLRRMLLNEQGRPQGILEYGDRKNLKSQRTVLVPGPASERRVVHRIFNAFVKRKSRTQIAADLNAEGILNARGKPWTSLTISNTLKNEAYAGNLVYNRRSQKLGEKQVSNPPEMWVRRDNAFKAVISPELFARAQRRLSAVEHGRILSDKQMLDKLRTLLRKKGHLSLKLMMTTKGVPHSKTYAQRFGSLAEAFRLVGYEPKARYCFKETKAKVDHLIAAVARNIISEIEKRRRSATYLNELRLLTISSTVTVALTVARVRSDGKCSSGPASRWEALRLRYKKSDLVLIARLSPTNEEIQDFFLLPTENMPKSKDGRVRISNRLFGDNRYPNFAAVISALHQRLDGPQFDFGLNNHQLNRLSAKQGHISANSHPQRKKLTKAQNGRAPL